MFHIQRRPRPTSFLQARGNSSICLGARDLPAMQVKPTHPSFPTSFRRGSACSAFQRRVSACFRTRPNSELTFFSPSKRFISMMSCS